MKTKIVLLQKQIDYLQILPEQGMGYHVVDITLKNGKVFNNIVVLNSMYLHVEDNIKIDPNEIEVIELHEQ